MAARFERSPGAYLAADGSVLSETQAYALLRDVWSNDRADFARTWAWTAAHLLRPDGLPAWLWRGGSIVDAHTAADADTDLALALLMAGRRWHDPALLEAGRSMVRSIWAREVVTVAGRPFLAAGDWAPGGNTDVVPFNPSYVAPYAYRVFAEADREHDWSALIDSGYQTLFALSQASLGASRSSGLPPDWVGVNKVTGALSPIAVDGKTSTTRYGFDAPRTYWRIALDRQWSGDGRAEAYLSQAGFIRDEVARKGAPSAVYAHDGAVVDASTSGVGTAGALAVLSVLDPPAEHGLFAAQVLGRAQSAADGQAAWAEAGDPDDAYEQAWGWFGTALYSGALEDVWHTS
jgi:endo-1,4-beta-D-glucanase Y